MAFEDGDVWLPSEFPYEFSSSSVFSSPVDSAVSSTESESDGDDSLTWLTRRFPHSSSLQPSHQKSLHALNLQKPPILFGAAESMYNKGSPNTPFKFPPSPLPQNESDLGPIYTPAGQVNRLKMPVMAPCRDLHLHPSPLMKIPATRVCPHGCLSCIPPKAHHIKQHSLGFGEFSESPFPPLQAQRSYGHLHPQHFNRFIPNAGFVNGSDYYGVKKSASTGTGVFLPRRYGNPSESRKKTGCTNPPPRARVSQIQNKNSLFIAAHLRPHGPQLLPRIDDNVNGLRNAVLIQQQKASLPQEWTY